MTRRGAIQTRRDDLDGRRTRLLELQEAPHPGVVSEPLTELLDHYARDVPGIWNCSTREHRDAVFGAIRREREQLGESAGRSYDELAASSTRRYRPSHAIPTTASLRRTRSTNYRRVVSAHRRARASRGLRAHDAAGH